MPTLTITIDEQTESDLQKMAQERGISPANMASRLLRRAVRVARIRLDRDIEALKVAYAEFAEEDIALSEATVAEHRELLAYEDRA